MSITSFLIIAGILWFLATILIGIAAFRKRKLATDIWKALGCIVLALSFGCMILAFGVGTRYQSYAEKDGIFSMQNYRVPMQKAEHHTRLINLNLKRVELETKQGFRYSIDLPKPVFFVLQND